MRPKAIDRDIKNQELIKYIWRMRWKKERKGKVQSLKTYPLHSELLDITWPLIGKMI